MVTEQLQAMNDKITRFLERMKKAKTEVEERYPNEESRSPWNEGHCSAWWKALKMAEEMLEEKDKEQTRFDVKVQKHESLISIHTFHTTGNQVQNLFMDQAQEVLRRLKEIFEHEET